MRHFRAHGILAEVADPRHTSVHDRFIDQDKPEAMYAAAALDAEAIVARVRDQARRQGLVWHHQGSGKTLLMAFAAAKLRQEHAVFGEVATRHEDQRGQPHATWAVRRPLRCELLQRAMSVDASNGRNLVPQSLRVELPCELVVVE